MLCRQLKVPEMCSLVSLQPPSLKSFGKGSDNNFDGFVKSLILFASQAILEIKKYLDNTIDSKYI